MLPLVIFEIGPFYSPPSMSEVLSGALVVAACASGVIDVLLLLVLLASWPWASGCQALSLLPGSPGFQAQQLLGEGDG